MTKLSLTAVLLLAVAACSSRPQLPRGRPGDGTVEVRGAIEGGPVHLGTAELGTLPQRSVRGIDPETGRAASFQGLALHELLDRLELRRGTDTLVVRTGDGEAIPIPIWTILQMRPVLANLADGTSLPDRVLAWPNVEQPGLETDPRARAWWARRVVALELVDWQRTYGTALRSPPGAPDAARLGSSQFGLRCVSCHQVRGVGGTKGPELTRAGESLDAQKFAAAVHRHPHFADGARRTDAPATEVVNLVWSFLSAVSRSGLPLAEDATEEPPPVKDAAADPRPGRG
jgi:hypothetical protein